MLVDSHCHLDRLDLFGDSVDVPEVLAEARARGISGFLAIGVDLTSSDNLIELDKGLVNAIKHFSGRIRFSKGWIIEDYQLDN